MLPEKVSRCFGNGAPEGGPGSAASRSHTRREDAAPGPLRSRHALLSCWDNEVGWWRLVLKGQCVLDLGCPPHWAGRNSIRLGGRRHHP